MSSFQLPRTRVATAYVLAISALALTSVGLTGALYHKVTQPPPEVMLVKDNDKPKVVVPGLVPDMLAHDFVADFVTTYETYTPSTLMASLDFANSRVSPTIQSDFEKLLDNRRKLVADSRMVSQFLIEDRLTPDVRRGKGRIEVVIRGVSRIYIANKLAQEGRRIYRVALEAGEPTRNNPTGLLVTGLSIKRLKSPGDSSEQVR